MNINELKRMEQPDLIKLIDSGQLIHIDNINGNNMAVIDRLSDCGYCVVSSSYAQQCVKESEELAHIKACGDPEVIRILKKIETDAKLMRKLL